MIFFVPGMPGYYGGQTVVQSSLLLHFMLHKLRMSWRIASVNVIVHV